LIRPATVILFEREIWPNFVWRANELGIPLLLVNARMSDRSFRLCRRFRFLFAPLYGSLAAAAAQSEADAEKLRCLGCPPHRVQVLGSLKYDAAVQSDGQSPDLSAPLRRAGAPLSGPILVCGSTHPGEEKVMAEIVQRLRRTVPQLYLILVPRHFERCPEAAKDLDRLGMPYVRWSALSGDSSPPAAEPAGCLLVDTTGLLRALYRAATVVFVGKSLKAMGGQNPIEPAALGKPMVFGPNMQNFREISDRLVAAGGAIRVHNEAELEVALAALLHDQQQRETMGQRARQVILENQGATQRTVQLIRAHLPCGTTEPRPTEQT
jgi:3-deoxy-D-manno-octulosonic-acid transferase